SGAVRRAGVGGGSRARGGAGGRARDRAAPAPPAGTPGPPEDGPADAPTGAAPGARSRAADGPPAWRPGTMLVLTRKLGEIIRVGEAITVRVLEVKRNHAPLAVSAPPNLLIYLP